MLTTITKVSDKKIEKVAFYENELSVRKNLISFIEQTFNGNFNFWTYPNNMKEIKTSKYGSLVYERNGEMYIARSRLTSR